MDTSKANYVKIIHFNDVYEIQGQFDSQSISQVTKITDEEEKFIKELMKQQQQMKEDLSQVDESQLIIKPKRISDPSVDLFTSISNQGSQPNIKLQNESIENLMNIKYPTSHAAIFVSALKHQRNHDQLNTVTVFSGDCFSPSLLTVFLNGDHMLQPLNACKIDVACIGNHEFDVGVSKLQELIQQTNFPWLLSNVKQQQNQIVSSKEYEIISKGGIQIGYIGLVDPSWLNNIKNININHLEYQCYIECAKRLHQYLSQEHNCDLVLAITHMNKQSDLNLAQNVPEIPIIFGGHDHEILRCIQNQTLILKSGFDFQNYHTIKIKFNNQQKQLEEDNKSNLIKDSDKEDLHTLIEQQFEQTWEVKFQKFKVELEIKSVTLENSEPDEEIQKFVNHTLFKIRPLNQKVIGYISDDIDLRDDVCRMKGTLFTNFMGDLIRSQLGCDCVILNSGLFRMNQIRLKDRPLRYDFMSKCFPFIDDIIVTKQIQGKFLARALENAVSLYPARSGRYPVVSGITFQFYKNKMAMKKIIQEEIEIQGTKIDLEKQYIVGLPQFIAKGKDGFESFLQGKYIIDDERGLYIGTYLLDILLNFSDEANKIYEIKRNQNPNQEIGNQAIKEIINTILVTQEFIKSREFIEKIDFDYKKKLFFTMINLQPKHQFLRIEELTDESSSIEPLSINDIYKNVVSEKGCLDEQDIPNFKDFDWKNYLQKQQSELVELKVQNNQQFTEFQKLPALVLNQKSFSSNSFTSIESPLLDLNNLDMQQSRSYKLVNQDQPQPYMQSLIASAEKIMKEIFIFNCEREKLKDEFNQLILQRENQLYTEFQLLQNKLSVPLYYLQQIGYTNSISNINALIKAQGNLKIAVVILKNQQHKQTNNLFKTSQFEK